MQSKHYIQRIHSIDMQTTQIPRVEIYNQAERVTVKPQTKFIEIAAVLYEVGYHYKRKVGKMVKGKGNKQVVWL